MCPSFRATGDEQHSTRGRARLLQELMTGELASEGWRSETVKDALDLCLSCKGCISDCPTHVDMASYKSEFLHQHYRRRLRPRSHYSLGWLPVLLRMGERMPRVVNTLTRGRLTRGVFSLAAGIEPDRPIPALARTTFRRGHRKRLATTSPTPLSDATVGGESVWKDGPNGRVVLWPDTFNDHLTPDVAHAAVRVMEAAGYAVIVPDARGLLRPDVDDDRPAGYRAPDPAIARWPRRSSTARSRSWSWSRPARRCSRRTWSELLPGRSAGGVRGARGCRRWRRCWTWSGSWRRRSYGARGECRSASASAAPPAISQPHCHHQAVLGLAADRRVRERNGIAVGTELAGCCGLAGNFGAERGHGAMSARWRRWR